MKGRSLQYEIVSPGVSGLPLPKTLFNRVAMSIPNSIVTSALTAGLEFEELSGVTSGLKMLSNSKLATG